LNFVPHLALSVIATTIEDPSTRPISRAFRRAKRRSIIHHPSDNVVGLVKHQGHDLLRRRGVTAIEESKWETAYVAPVEIDGKTFNLLVDTGSADTWVTTAKVNCTSESQTCGSPAQLEIKKDEKWEGDFSIGYGDGSKVSGTYTHRPLTIGSTKIDDQVIAIADTTVDFRGLTIYDGLLGLSKRDTYDTLFFNMVKKGLLEDPCFSLVLLGDSDPNNNKDGGYLTFGGYPPAVKPTSDWAAAPLVQANPVHTYTIRVDGFKVAGKEVPNLGDAQRTVLVDSGTTFTMLHEAVAAEIWKGLPGEGSDPKTPCDESKPDLKCTDQKGRWRVPCKDGKMPEFSVVIDGIQFPMRKENLVVELNPGQCFAGIQPIKEGVPAILGLTWMRGVLSLFDYKDPKKPGIQFATYK